MKTPTPLIYFDSGMFITLLSGPSAAGDEVGQLLKELNRERARIYTSVISVQETSVLSFRQGRSGRDTTEAISRYARIVAVDRRTSLMAAKIEAEILDLGKLPVDEQLKTRRKWDCFHLATASALGCSVLYTADQQFRNTAKRLKLDGLRVLEPKPTNGLLFTKYGNVISMPKNES